MLPATQHPLPTDDREMKLLLALGRTRQRSELRIYIHDLADEGIDWERLYELAWRHRLSPLISRSLEESGIAVPKDIRDALGRDRTAAVLRSLAYAHELLQIHAACHDARIDFAVLKGPVLGTAFYSDLGLRPFGDLDILVKFDDVLRAKEVLVALGYRPDPPMSLRKERAFLTGQSAYEFYEDEKGFKVELHSALVHRRFGVYSDIEKIWTRMSALPIGNVSISVLSVEDLLLFLCVHGAKHSWKQLIWVCDIAEIVRSQEDIDWSTLVAEAEMKECGRMLYLGLYLAHVWLDAPIPALIQTQILREGPLLEALASDVRERAAQRDEVKVPFSSELRFHLLVRETRRDKWLQVIEKAGDRAREVAQNVRVAVRPSKTDHSFINLPPVLTPLYLIVRPVRILWTMLTSGSRK